MKPKCATSNGRSVPPYSKSKFSKKEKKGKIMRTTQDSVKSWNKFYASQNFGLWIQCDNQSCKKWRRVMEYEEPEQVPPQWFCYMNRDTKYNSCEAKEEVLPEGQYSTLEFEAGFIVWAQIPGYPRWPAIIEDCPDEDDYYQEIINPGMEKIEKYHVTFFDTVVSRAWVNRRCISKLHRTDSMPILRGRNKKLITRLKTAFDTASKALNMRIEQRLDEYSFSKRHEGPFPSADAVKFQEDSLDHESEMEPDVFRENLNITRNLYNEVTALDGLKDDGPSLINNNEISSQGHAAIDPVNEAKIVKKDNEKVRNKSNSVPQKQGFSKSDQKKKVKGLKLKRKIGFTESQNKNKKLKIARNDKIVDDISIEISSSSKSNEMLPDTKDDNNSKVYLNSCEANSENTTNIELGDKDMNIVNSSMREEKIKKLAKAGKFKSKRKNSKHEIMPKTIGMKVQNFVAMENSIVAMEKLKITEIGVCSEEKVKSTEESGIDKTNDEVKDKKNDIISNGNVNICYPESNERNDKSLKNEEPYVCDSEEEPYDYDSDEVFNDYELGLHDIKLASSQVQEIERPKTGTKIVEEKMEIIKDEKVEETNSHIETKKENDVFAKIDGKEAEVDQMEKDVIFEANAEKKGKDVLAEADNKKVETEEKKNNGKCEVNGKQCGNEDFNTAAEIKISEKKYRGDLESNENLIINGEQNNFIKEETVKSKDPSKIDDQKAEIKIEKHIPDFSRKSKAKPFKPQMTQGYSTDQTINNSISIYVSATEDSNVTEDTMNNAIGDIADESLITNEQNEIPFTYDCFNAQSFYPMDDLGYDLHTVLS